MICFFDAYMFKITIFPIIILDGWIDSAYFAVEAPLQPILDKYML